MSLRTKPSKKRKRVLYLAWMIRNRFDVHRATQVLASMGYGPSGWPLPKARS